jgi:UDP-N-acetylglucosamine pyrophosphorylase
MAATDVQGTVALLKGLVGDSQNKLLDAVSGDADLAWIQSLLKSLEDSTAGGKDFASLWPTYEEKMKKDGCNDAAVAAFKYTFGVLCSGKSTMIPESSLDKVDALPELDKLEVTENPELLKCTLVLKLNGGLGTGMGLDKAKSLLTVNDGNTFLDLIAKQVAFMKTKYSQPDLKFMLMNSFSTSKDTLEALSKYPDLGTGADLEFVQNKAPKVTASDYTPASWEKDPGHEWCPPGHGDLYAAILGSGTLDKLLAAGMKYMFVSNSDNLGATMDLKILSHFVSSGAPFMMEVAARTDADKKGGHLGKLKEGGGLTLRESAQCPKEDEAAFQDTSKYTYFNTNNLWVDLVKLKETFEKSGGAIPLPVMLNDKTVDPRDKQSTKVVQLETAMGAAISCFEGATALLIPRTRFAPVKKCEDLLALRSDAFVLTEDFRVELHADRQGKPPVVKLDDRYKFVDAMETLIPNGPPSLLECTKLTVKGEVEFAAGVVCKGEVTFNNGGEGKKTVAAGTYEGQTVDL